MSDTLTILTSLDKPCAKHFELQDAEWAERSKGMAFRFDVEERSVTGLNALCQLLNALKGDQQAGIIRGKSIGALPISGVRRKLDQFEPAARQWCLIDIDELPIPEEFEDFNDHLPELVCEAVRHLPSEFQNVDCWYQFSSSMGIKKGKIRIHLWFWLSRKTSDAEMRAWLGEGPVDLRLFHPVQLHYIAQPIFSGGSDPLPQRSGRHDAARGHETVSVPHDLKTRTGATLNKPRHVRQGGVVESQDIIRSPITGLVVDGRERLLFELSNEVTAELVRAGPRGEVPTAQEIADRLWIRFNKEADTNDNKWTEEDAKKKALARHKELESGDFKFTARAESNILLPTTQAHFPMALVTKEVGEKRLTSSLNEFFSVVEEGSTPRQVVKITMGAGKTTKTISHLKSFLEHQSNKLVEIYVPRHDIADEYEHKLSLEPAVNASVVHIYPRTGGQVNNDTGRTQFAALCNRANYVRSLEKAGHFVYRSACQSDDGDTCEHFSECAYLNQFRQQTATTSPDHNGNVIRIYQHAQLGLPRNRSEEEQTPDLLVIDEAFLPSLLDTQQSVSTEDLRVHLRPPKKAKLGHIVVEALRDSKPLLAALRGAGVGKRDLDAIQLDSLSSSHGFDATRNSEKTFPDTAKYRAISTVVSILREELRNPNRDHIERLTYDAADACIKISVLKKDRIPENAPLLILDATADQSLVEKIVGPVAFEQIDIEQKAVVTQVYDHSGSNTWWNHNPARVDELVMVLNEWVTYGETPLCVSHKKLADALRSHTDLNDQVKVLNFGGLRGSNAAEGCSVVFITGRNQLPAPAIDQKARAIFWDDDQELKHDDASNDLPREVRGYLLSDRYKDPQAGVQVRTFSDPRIEKLHAQEREAETIQAIARLRLVHSPYVKRVFLLGNLPVGIPVDRLITMDELMPDGLEKELLNKRNLPITALGLVKMRPDLTANQDTAKKMLQRSPVTDIKTLAAVMPHLSPATIFVATFKAGDSRRTKHEHLFLPEIAIAEHDGIVGGMPSQSDIEKFLVAGWGDVDDLEISFWGGAFGSH